MAGAPANKEEAAAGGPEAAPRHPRKATALRWAPVPSPEEAAAKPGSATEAAAGANAARGHWRVLKPGAGDAAAKGPPAAGAAAVGKSPSKAPPLAQPPFLEQPKQPLTGEDTAARLAARALGQLDLGAVHSALAVGGTEAARGATAILALAATGVRACVAPPSLAAEAAARELLGGEGAVTSDDALCKQVSIVQMAALKSGECGSFDLAIVVAGLRDSPAAASAIPTVACALRPGGRMIVALTPGPRSNAVSRAATEAAKTPSVCRVTAQMLVEATTSQPPACSDPAAFAQLLESSGLHVVSVSRYVLEFPGPASVQVNGPPLGLAAHLAAAWAGAPVGAEGPQEEAERVLFEEVARLVSSPFKNFPEEVLEAEAIRPSYPATRRRPR